MAGLLRYRVLIAAAASLLAGLRFRSPRRSRRPAFTTGRCWRSTPACIPHL